MWMEQALIDSHQTIAMFSNNYVDDKAVYSKAELFSTWWSDPLGERRKLIPVALDEVIIPMLFAPIKRISAIQLSPEKGAKVIFDELASDRGVGELNSWRTATTESKIFKTRYMRNARFSGRLEDIDTIHNLLVHGRSSRVVISGMGGLGKSTLASEFGHTFSTLYAGVWWIDASSNSSVEQSFRELASLMSDEARPSSALQRVRDSKEPWLLVFDDLSSETDIHDWLPEGNSHVLILSRDARSETLGESLNLKLWPRATTVAFLEDRTKRVDRAGLCELADILDGLPLAVEQAATYLKRNPWLTYEEYTADIVRRSQLSDRDLAFDQYKASVFAVFTKSLDDIVAKAGSGPADLISLLSTFDPNGIAFDILANDRARTVLPSTLSGKEGEINSVTSALSYLNDASLIVGNPGTISAHKLSLAIQWSITSDTLKHQLLDTAPMLLSIALPSDVSVNTAAWPSYSRLMPHIVWSAEHPPTNEQSLKALDRLMNGYTIFFGAQGRYDEAKEWSRRSLELKRLTRQDQPAELAIGLVVRASAISQDDPREAIKLCEEAFLTLRTGNILVHHVYGTLHRVKSMCYLRTGAVEKGIEAAVAARGYWTESSGPNTLEVGLAELMIAAGLRARFDQSRDSNDLIQAKTHSATGRKLVLEKRGLRHPEVLEVYSDQAVEKMMEGDIGGAWSSSTASLATIISLGMNDHRQIKEIVEFLSTIANTDPRRISARLYTRGNYDDLGPLIANIENAQRKWVDADPSRRSFGAPSGYRTPAS